MPWKCAAAPQCVRTLLLRSCATFNAFCRASASVLPLVAAKSRGMMHSVLALPQIVIYSGIGLSVVPAITLLFFDDDKCLNEEEGDEDEDEVEGTSAKEEDAAGVHPAIATWRYVVLNRRSL